jgi:hypothetical protein
METNMTSLTNKYKEKLEIASLFQELSRLMDVSGEEFFFACRHYLSKEEIDEYIDESSNPKRVVEILTTLAQKDDEYYAYKY